MNHRLDGELETAFGDLMLLRAPSLALHTDCEVIATASADSQTGPDHAFDPHRTSLAVTVTHAHRVDQARRARGPRRWPTWWRPATAFDTKRGGSRLVDHDRADAACHPLLSAVVVIASVAIAAGCGNRVRPDSAVSSTVTSFGELDAPPDVILRADDHRIAVAAFGFHTPTAVADGTTLPPGGPDVVVETAELVIENSPPGWTFAARFTVPSDPDGPRQHLVIEALDSGRVRLLPPPAAGTYDVWLEGTNNGSAASYVFRWIHEVPPTQALSPITHTSRRAHTSDRRTTTRARPRALRERREWR
jgi:hypothetical protein